MLAAAYHLIDEGINAVTYINYSLCFVFYKWMTPLLFGVQEERATARATTDRSSRITRHRERISRYKPE